MMIQPTDRKELIMIRKFAATVLVTAVCATPGAVMIAAGGTALELPSAEGASSDPLYILGMHRTQSGGFSIHWSEGHRTKVPPRDMAMTMCRDYTYRVERIACKATTRTSYRWMKITMRSIHAVAP